FSEQWLPGQRSHQTLATGEHTTVHTEDLSAGVKVGLFDLGGWNTELVGNDAVSVYDPLPSQAGEQPVRSVFPLGTAEGVTGRHSAPHIPPLGEVVAVQDFGDRGVDLVDR